MKKIAYMGCDSYIVATDDAIIVLDYNDEPSHALKHTLSENPDLPVVFIETHHRREPHATRSLYEIAQNHRRTYIMSNDIFPKNIPSDLEVAGLSAGDSLENIPGISRVRAYGSNNEGISVVAELNDGTKLYHAGSMRHNHSADPTLEYRDHEKINSIINRVADDYPNMDIAILPAVPDGVAYDDSVIDCFTKKINVSQLIPMNLPSDSHEQCPYEENLPKQTECKCLHKGDHYMAI